MEDNQGGADTSVITQLEFFGSPASGAGTDMKGFSRVAGKPGESD